MPQSEGGELSPSSSTPKRKGPVIGIAVGIGLTCAPLVGMLISGGGLFKAFRAVDGNAVPPDQKANQLAEGIDTAMNAAMVSIVVGMIGSVILTASLIWWVVTRKKPAATPE